MKKMGWKLTPVEEIIELRKEVERLKEKLLVESKKYLLVKEKLTTANAEIERLKSKNYNLDLEVQYLSQQLDNWEKSDSVAEIKKQSIEISDLEKQTAEQKRMLEKAEDWIVALMKEHECGDCAYFDDCDYEKKSCLQKVKEDLAVRIFMK